ncbi:MAG TPA: transporter substrate-binding domain-containing protein [Anaerolineae bacterium]|nr:transporter substrate-binding domain-containing protein [Anaerolineae bacterium]HNU03441.1 transporter substrate-binding domain-containing protein [Anaerolineae bacterium]
MTRKNRRIYIVALLALLALTIAACGGSAQPQPTALPEPTPTAPVGLGDVWAKAQQSGKLVVGVSADYPPFEFYNDQFQLDGFDIALMRAIGEKLGVQVEFKDFAFDGLGSALQLGQIDAAISAISVTDQRAQQVDFSNIYYVGADALLVAENSPLTSLTIDDDLSDLRLAVQSGTVYESFADQELVEAGLLPEDNLHAYTDIEQAVRDLQRGRVDAVLMDRQPALAFEANGGVRNIGQGLFPQNFAVAVALGQDPLRRVINQALEQLGQEGVMEDLVVEYLKLPPTEIIPLPTPEPETPTATPAPKQPTPTAQPQPACIDGMAWVADLNYDDKNMTAPPVIPPGQPFVKSWRIRNSGTCTWDSRYVLAFDRGNVAAAQMGGQPAAIQGTVAPGATYDISVNLTAPSIPGVYQGFWQMRNPSNTAFGETIWVGIRVPAPAQPTPAPTQTPVPGISFTTTSNNIVQGQCVTNSWSTSNVQAVFYFQQGQNWETQGVEGVGSRQECPQQTTTYFLRVQMRDGSVQTRELTVAVTPIIGAPVISQFTASPLQINVGQCVTLQWNVEGSTTRVALLRNNGALWDGAPVRGSFQDCPPGAGQMTYALQASGPGGSSQAVQTVAVLTAQPTNTPVPPTPTPVPPTPTPPPPTPTTVPPPVIVSFAVQPGQIEPGQCVTVSWNTGGGAAFTRLFRNGAIIQDNAPVNSSIQDCLNDVASYTYQLQAFNVAGAMVSQEAVINVRQPQPTNTPVPALTGAWSAVQIGGQPVVAGTMVTANFSGGQVSGSGGCNTYTASFSTSGNNVSISYPMASQMACAPEVLEQETRFFQSLSSAATYEISGNNLTLRNGGGAVVVVFGPGITPF